MQPNHIDIIILSDAKNDFLRKITEQAISTLISSENPNQVDFNIFVIESNQDISPYKYRNTTTIYPKQKFGYNKFINIGISAGDSQYICLCNNDLIFHRNWASEILKAFGNDRELMSASPICSLIKDPEYIGINTGNHYGYAIRKHISGWCIFVKREFIVKYGYFDEHFKFWYADNDYANILRAKNLKHVIVSSAIVDHLASKTLNKTPKLQKYILTTGEFIYFDFKWNHKNIFLYFSKILRFKTSTAAQTFKKFLVKINR